MKLVWLELANFRCYEQLRLEPDAGVNVLVGPNGAGKTNLLEAITYATALKSFRGVPDEALIREGEDTGIVRAGVLRSADRSTVIEIELPRNGRRWVLVNGRRPARAAEMLGHVRSVVFLPDDLDIVKRGPVYRRDFFDSVAVQLWPGAYLDQQEYDRSLRQRNTLLRQSGREVDVVTLAVWDERLSQAGGKLMVRRAAAASALAQGIIRAYRRLAGENTDIALHYSSGWGGTLEAMNPEQEAERLLGALQRARKQDVDRKTSTVGPHRDEPWFSLDGRDTRTSASQGELRTLALSLRLAAHAAIEDRVGEAPLLLLDDVFSELDLERAGALARLLPAAQTFITTAREEEVPVRGRRYTVEQGVVQ